MPEMTEKKKGIAIVPGSFDPITLGHVDIARRAAERFETVYFAVMINPDKRYMFTIDERVEIAKAALRGIDGVEVISSEGMLWKLALDLGACAIVKGVRNDVDREYELKMAEFNSAHNPEAETILLDTAPALKEISSTLVREAIENGYPLAQYLPPKAIEAIRKIREIRENR